MTKLSTFKQQERGWMIYPGRGWRKFVFELPVFLWRIGLARLTQPNFLLLTAFGRKSGRPRRTMLEYTFLDGHFYLASGWGNRSQWVQNILVNPRVTVQTIHEGICSGKAVTVTDEAELRLLYERMRGKSPIWVEYLASWEIQDSLQDFLAKRERLVIFRVDPDGEPAQTPQYTDLDVAS